MKTEELDDNKMEDDYIDEPSAATRIITGFVVVVLVLAVIALVWILFLRGENDSIHVEEESVLLEENNGNLTNVPETVKDILCVAGDDVIQEQLERKEAEKQQELLEEAVVPEAVEDNTDFGLVFAQVEETVTAKEVTNLRNMPNRSEESKVITTLLNGELATRIGISDTGWSKLEYNGEVCYAVTSLLTTDLTTKPVVEEADDGINTVFTACNDKVSPKIEVNVRTLPSVTNPESTVVVMLSYGEVVTRTGINTVVGWSRVIYNGQVLYCISSYVYVVEE